MSTSEELRRHYQGFYTGNEKEWRRIGALGKADNIVRAWRAIGGSNKPSVVELGCGDGAIAARLAELGFFASYRGFDLSDSGIGQARARELPGAAFAVSPGTPIPVPDDDADVVIMSHVIEHLEHPRELIAEARRIAPLLIAEVPLELNQYQPVDYDWAPIGHINHYNPIAIRKLIQTCRFDIVDQFTTNPSREVTTYNSPGWKSNAKWAVKELGLNAAPKFAKKRFTYHETLAASRNDRRIG